jgi:hypothetical protein
MFIPNSKAHLHDQPWLLLGVIDGKPLEVPILEFPSVMGQRLLIRRIHAQDLSVTG